MNSLTALFYGKNIFLMSFIVISNNYRNFAERFIVIMKKVEKNARYNEERAGKVEEPVGAACRSEVSSLGYNIDNWPGMPIVGPDNLEEMNARIDQSEQDMELGKGFSWEQVMQDAQSIVNRYAATVY